MSSFLSSPTQFAPYRDPFNLQLYAQIGTAKQSAYQSGIERVQGVYDTVAGLKMGRPEDTEYLNQKLSGLQTNIQKLAGSNFSQSNVVSQAGGYASMIYNDQRIVKDVISAQNASDAQNQIQEARKNGKSAASNDNAVMRNINAWQQGGADASLGKQQYTPYYNYSKSWQDFMSGKHANTVYWESDGSGRSDRGIAYTLNQGKKTYIDPATVQRDFETFLQMDGQAQGQVQLDALYYSDRTPDEIAFQGIRSNAEMTLQSYDEGIRTLQQQKVTNNTPADIAQIDDQIEQINAAKAKLSLRVNNGDLEREFIQNPEQGKMQLFMRGLTVGAGNRYAYSEVENKTVKNPLFEADLDAQKLGIAYQDLALRQASETRLQNKEAREAAKDARELQGTSGGGILLGTGGYEALTTTPELIISDVKTQEAEVRQQQLEMLFSTGQYSDMITQGQDAQGRALYNINPGRESDFARVWKDVGESYYKSPQSADPNVREYYEAENNPNYGLGKLRSYTSLKKQITNTEDKLKQQFANDPEYQAYVGNVSQLGDLSQVLSSEDGQQITRQDLIKFASAMKEAPSGYSAEVARKAGISKEKADVIARRGLGNLGGFGDIGKAIISAGQYDPSDPRAGGFGDEYRRISQAITSNKKYSQARTEAYKPLQNIRPTVTLTEAEDGANKKIMADRIAAIQQIATGLGASQLDGVNSVVNASEKGVTKRVSLTGQLLPNGKVNAIVTNAGGDSYALPLEPHQAQVMFPSLLQQNPNQVIETMLNANAPFPGAPSVTGTGVVGAFRPQYSNLNNYQINYQVKSNSRGQVTPLIQYYRKGENSWRSLGNFKYFNSSEEMRAFVDQVAKYDDKTFESTFLSE